MMYLIQYQWGNTALFAAANLGHIEVAKLLLDKGADVNLKDEVSEKI